MAKLVQVRLKAVTVKENGYWEDQENIVAFTLVYPREGAPAVCAVRRVKLTSGERLDFAAELRRRGQPYDDLLFRETVRAESPLVVEISAVYSADWLGKLLSKALGAAAGAAAGLLPVGTVGLAFLGSSTGALFERLGSQEKVHVIAKGFALLSPGMAAGDVTVDLSVPEDVTLWKAAPPPTSMGTKPPEDQQKTLRKNAPNGSVTVSVQLLDV